MLHFNFIPNFGKKFVPKKEVLSSQKKNLFYYINYYHNYNYYNK